MSGIACKYNLEGHEVDRADIVRMTEAMAHRGPDGRDCWCAGAVGLGHCRLHTTPESLAEHLPLTHGALTITADARIDNRSELIAVLGLQAEQIVPDSSLILAAYARWGASCVEHLIGDFAFAIWDASSAQLFCARDHFGVRPFYYHYAPGVHFVCATEIKALLTQEGVPQRLNEVRLGDYLSGMREDAEITIYKDIWRLPPAHTLTVDASGEVAVRRYWHLQPAEGVEAMSEQEQIARLKTLFEDAVRCRLRSAFPVASELSGGLDSSYVTCVARDLQQAQGGRLHTISLVFDQISECDERDYIESVLQEGQVEAHFVAGDAVGPLSNLEEVYSLLDDNLVGGNQHLVWEMLRAAREAGARVVLDGVDGDTTISHGHLYLRELVRDGKWEAFKQEAIAIPKRYAVADHKHDFQETLGSERALINTYAWPQFNEYAERGNGIRFFLQAARMRRHFRFKWGQLIRQFAKKMIVPEWVIRARQAQGVQQEPLPPMADPVFAERIGLRERLRRFAEFDREPRSIREQQEILFNSARLVSALETTNHYAAILGLEKRHPFMDKRLIEFCLALPGSMRLRDGWTRYILRRAMDGVVPDKIAWRVGKGRMSANFRYGLNDVNGPLLKRLVSEPGILGPYIHFPKLLEMYQRRAELSEIEAVKLAQMATLSLWLNKRFSSRDRSQALSNSGASMKDAGFSLSLIEDHKVYAASV